MADTEITNYKTDIVLTWGVGDGSDKGVAYAEEYGYFRKHVDDHKAVGIRDNTPINMAFAPGYSSYPGSTPLIRYKIDRDRQTYFRWSNNQAGTLTSRLLPAYSSPFTFVSQQYEAGAPILGGIGYSAGSASSKTARYHKGIVDEFGDEWHTMGCAIDMREGAPSNVDQAFFSDSGKETWFILNPKTPMLEVRASGYGQFRTTNPKAYWTPKIVTQTTYISGTCTLKIINIWGGNVWYRIGESGGFTDAGASSVTLTQDAFADGASKLYYYYDPAFIKYRNIVKNPTHPSLAEPHGHWLGLTAGSASLATIKGRIARAPYKAIYDGYRNDATASGTAWWDTNGYQGKRMPKQYDGGGALKCAFVALMEGPGFARTEGGKTLLRYAIEMIEDQHRTIDPIGFEWAHKTDPIPNTICHFTGYYDSTIVLQPLFAYDIIAANFRSDQVEGGMTPIEDIHIRETFAAFAYEQMMWLGGMTERDPGMWGTARLLAAQAVAMVMPEYSSPLYGTSGFGMVQTKYPLCPFQDDQYTWKEAMWDGGKTLKAFPNLKYQVSAGDLFYVPPVTISGTSYNEYSWSDKASYVGTALMGIHFGIWANLASRGYGKSDAKLNAAMLQATTGSGIWGTKTPYERRRVAALTQINSQFPDIAQNNFEWIKSATGDESLGSSLRDNGVFGIVWYDDQWEATAPVTEAPTIISQPTPQVVTEGNNANFAVQATGIPSPSYQWRKNGTNIGGQTNNTLSLTAVTLGDAGNYSCYVSNTAGNVTSNVVALVVTPTPPPAPTAGLRARARSSVWKALGLI